MSELVAKTPYSTIQREIIGGNEYLKFSSSPAVTVLLLTHYNERIALMAQSREDTNGQRFFKTVGGYLKPGETPAEGAVRNLASKVGVTCDKSSLVEVGILSGYGDAIKVPITLMVCRYGDWMDSAPRAEGVNLVIFEKNEALELLATQDIYDDATRLQILYWMTGMF